MPTEVKVPALGESITEGTLAEWGVTTDGVRTTPLSGQHRVLSKVE